jgi:hypothetical protein
MLRCFVIFAPRHCGRCAPLILMPAVHKKAILHQLTSAMRGSTPNCRQGQAEASLSYVHPERRRTNFIVRYYASLKLAKSYLLWHHGEGLIRQPETKPDRGTFECLSKLHQP